VEYTDNGQPLKIFEQASTRIRTLNKECLSSSKVLKTTRYIYIYTHTPTYTLGHESLPVKTVKGLGCEL